MKIYRNNVCIKMELDEFLEILESDMIDELVDTILELDKLGVGSVVEEYNLEWIDVDDDDDDDDDDEENEAFSTEEFLELFGVNDAKKSEKMSEEDRKLRKMVELFCEGP